MIARLAILLIAGALALPAAAAQSPSAAPDPAALDLARLLMTRDPTLYDDADLGRFRSRIENALLATVGGCNPYLSDCRLEAAALAAEYAPALRRHQREISERMIATELAAALRPEEMVRVAAWLRSGEGGRFLDAWAALRDPESVQRRRRAVHGDPAESAPAILNPVRALFLQRTRNIPRAPPR